jgi:hypothetical protein
VGLFRAAQTGVLKYKHQAVSQGVRRFAKRSIFSDMLAFTKAAQRQITA